MKHLLFFASLLYTLVLQSQVTSISVEEFLVHSGMVGNDDLTGYTTYHIYANTTNPEDFVSAVYGDASYPLSLSIDGEIFHSAPFSADFAQDVNPLFLEQPTFQSLEFDSWLTIGIQNSDDNGEVQNILTLLDDDTGEIIFDALADFNSTGSFYVNNPIGGSWFNLMTCDQFDNDGNPIENTCTLDFPQFGGADNKVLLGQITTNGSFCGVFNLQVFIGGNQENNVYINSLGFCSNEGEIFGCTDENATNFDPTATVDDYTCLLPCTLELVVESAVSPSCPGDNDGSLTITSTGAQGNDYYYLGEDDVNASLFGNFSNLFGGSYYVMVTDDAGCSVSQMVEVPELEELEVNATLIQGMSCNNINDAIIEVEGTGGTGDLQFYFQSDDPSTMSSNVTYTDLGEGSYTIIAVDENGCLDNSFPVQINNPPAINVYITGYSDASCADNADGVIVAAITGGAAPSTNVFLIDGVTYESSPIEISGGNYLVEAIDIYGCIGSAAEEITIGPNAIIINSDSTPVSCTDDEDGSIAWAPSGGVGGFSVVVDGESVTGTDDLDGLAPGFYTIEVVDANGCTANELVEVENAPAIEVTAETIDVLCNGDSNGSVLVLATGGSGEFSYSDDDNNYSTDSLFVNLSAGDYVFYIQDGNACETTVSAIIDEPAELSVNGIVTDDPTDNNEGSIAVNISGGTPDYSYDWSGPGVNGTNTQDLYDVSAGTYILEVIDGNGCTVVEEFVISSVFELPNGIEIKVFPNPSNGLFNVVWNGSMGGDVVFNIVDGLGRIIDSGVWNETFSSFNTVIDLSGLESGMYRLNVISNGIPSSMQLIKAN